MTKRNKIREEPKTQDKKVNETENPEMESSEKNAKKPRTRGRRDKSKEKIAALEAELQELKDKNLRLFAEFDNFRKRTIREKIDFAKIAGQDIMLELLPVLDDFDRAKKSMESAEELQSVKEGMTLIYQKFYQALGNKGLKPMNAVGQLFDPEMHEAISELAAKNDEQKGIIMDEVEKGYYLNDKIIRYAKVVVGK